MKHDLTKALKAPNVGTTWNQLITCYDQLRVRNAEKIREVVNAMVVNPVTQAAIRKHMNVSERYKVTLRDAFNYLYSTYQAAMDFNERAGDWTTILRVFTLNQSVYIVVQQGEGAVDAYNFLREMIPHAAPFGLPAPTKKLNTSVTSKWRQVLNKSDTHFRLDVVTLVNFSEYEDDATESFLSK